MGIDRITAAVAAALALVAVPATAQTVIAASDFSLGPAGWRAFNGVTDDGWQLLGGNPGGFMRATDANTDALWFFAAPAAFLGDLSAAYGGALAYDLRVAGAAPPHLETYADLQILGANGVRLVRTMETAPGNAWTSFLVPLVADGAWRIGAVDGAAASALTFQQVLAGVTELRIRGDHLSAFETTGLDNVVLTAVPEPAALALWAAGLGVCAMALRRRRQT